MCAANAMLVRTHTEKTHAHVARMVKVAKWSFDRCHKIHKTKLLACHISFYKHIVIVCK